MQWFLFAVAAWLVWAALAAVMAVGKVRQPTTGGVAALVVLINGVIVAGLILAAVRWPHA
ncbi:hypothetical protein ACFZAR_42900 [Streptomyces sp. NPDC008222]|uniref:hypothetical protein n=1 Tax=Streptomyces sp. NPDC008222 TaxID=3364820 RepID=UPI0036E2A491